MTTTDKNEIQSKIDKNTEHLESILRFYKIEKNSDDFYKEILKLNIFTDDEID